MRIQVTAIHGRKRTHNWWQGELEVVLFAIRAGMVESSTPATYVLQDANGFALATVQLSKEWPNVTITALGSGEIYRHLLELVDDDPTLEPRYEQTDIDRDSFATMSAERSSLQWKGGCLIV